MTSLLKLGFFSSASAALSLFLLTGCESLTSGLQASKTPISITGSFSSSAGQLGQPMAEVAKAAAASYISTRSTKYILQDSSTSSLTVLIDGFAPTKPSMRDALEMANKGRMVQGFVNDKKAISGDPENPPMVVDYTMTYGPEVTKTSLTLDVFGRIIVKNGISENVIAFRSGVPIAEVPAGQDNITATDVLNLTLKELIKDINVGSGMGDALLKGLADSALTSFNIDGMGSVSITPAQLKAAIEAFVDKGINASENTSILSGVGNVMNRL